MSQPTFSSSGLSRQLGKLTSRQSLLGSRRCTWQPVLRDQRLYGTFFFLSLLFTDFSQECQGAHVSLLREQTSLFYYGIRIIQAPLQAYPQRQRSSKTSVKRRSGRHVGAKRVCCRDEDLFHTQRARVCGNLLLLLIGLLSTGRVCGGVILTGLACAGTGRTSSNHGDCECDPPSSELNADKQPIDRGT